MAVLTSLLITLTAALTITCFFFIPSLSSPPTNFKIRHSKQSHFGKLQEQDVAATVEDDTTTTITRTMVVTRTRTMTRQVTATRSAAVYTASSKPSPVPVEMFIMSRCPDAQECIHDLVLPLMANISDKITLTPQFIGELDDRSGGVHCMHGESECLGNIVELCVQSQNTAKPQVWLPFYDCLFSNTSLIPQSEFIHGCANDHGVDFEAMNKCASDMEGESGGGEMLRNSVLRSQKLGIRTSCTVTVDGKKRCVRDGGQWDREDCDVASVQKEIEALYEKNEKAAGAGEPEVYSYEEIVEIRPNGEQVVIATGKKHA